MRMLFAFAVAIVGSSLLLAGPNDSTAPPDRPNVSSINQQPMALPAGFTVKDLKEQNDIKKSLATVTQDAVEKNHFDNLCNCLAKPDKDRLGSYKNRNVDEMNGRIDQVRKAWKEKYGKDFDFDNYKVVFGDQYRIIQGEVSDPAVAVINWPVPAYSNEAMKAGERQPPANPSDRKGEEKQAKAEKLEKGRDVALVRIPAGDNLPDLTVSMIHQFPDTWKFDIPDNRTGEQIYNDLLAQLTWLGEHSANWPATQDDAYRTFTHHVLAALYGVQPTGTTAGDRSNTP